MLLLQKENRTTCGSLHLPYLSKLAPDLAARRGEEDYSSALQPVLSGRMLVPGYLYLSIGWIPKPGEVRRLPLLSGIRNHGLLPAVEMMDSKEREAEDQ